MNEHARADARQEFANLSRRAGYTSWAINFGALSTLLVCALIAALFLDALLGSNLRWLVGALFVPAMMARLCFVRGFARHRSATDSRTEIPPLCLLPHHSTRARPHLYTEDEIRRCWMRRWNFLWPGRRPLYARGCSTA